MLVKYNIKRLNPDAERPEPYYQEYEVSLAESNTVLDGLIKIREEIDGSLTLESANTFNSCSTMTTTERCTVSSGSK